MNLRFTVRKGFTVPLRIWVKSPKKTVYIFIGPNYNSYKKTDSDYPDILIPVKQATEAGTWARLNIISEENGKMTCALKKIVSADGKFELLGKTSISPELDSDVTLRFSFDPGINYDINQFSLLPLGKKSRDTE